MKDIVLLTSLVLTSPAYAEGFIAIAPVFSQIVTMPVPDGFEPAYEDANADSYINEAVLAGETVNDWSQMITLTGIRAMASVDPNQVSVDFAEYLADQYAGACPDTFNAVALNPPSIRGARGVFAGFLGCGDNGAGQSEAMTFLVLVGESDVYSLQWAERGPLSGSGPEYDETQWSPRLGELTAAARICDRIPGEEPPYPSCISD
jgi:hypothetical protein